MKFLVGVIFVCHNMVHFLHTSGVKTLNQVVQFSRAFEIFKLCGFCKAGYECRFTVRSLSFFTLYLRPCGISSSRNKHRRVIFASKVTVTVGKDPASDPEFLLEKLGKVDFASIGGDAAGGKGLQALTELRHSLAKVRTHVLQLPPKHDNHVA